MSSWGDRFKEVREKNKLSQAEVGRAILKDGTQISRYEKGRVKKFPPALYHLLRDVFTPEEIHYIEHGDDVDVVEEPRADYGRSSIPVLSATASAGSGNNIESIDAWETRGSVRVDERMFPGGIDGVRAIEVDGQSMVPVVMPGAWVFCRQSREWNGDGLYVLVFRGVLMVKQVTADPATGHLWIRSANDDYPSWEYDPTEDQSTMRIVGRVIRVMQ